MKGKDVKVGMKVYRNSKFHWARKPLFIVAEPGEYREYGRSQGNYGGAERFIKRKENDNPHSFNKATVAVSGEKGGKIREIVTLNSLISEEQYERQTQAEKASTDRMKREEDKLEAHRDGVRNRYAAVGGDVNDLRFFEKAVRLRESGMEFLLSKAEGK